MTSEPARSADRSAVDRPQTRSKAALISIARGEGAEGVGEGGADEFESEDRESLEWAEMWPIDASEGLDRS